MSKRIAQRLTHIQVNAGLEAELQNRTPIINQLPNVQRSAYDGHSNSCDYIHVRYVLWIGQQDLKSLCCTMKVPPPVHQRPGTYRNVCHTL